MSSKPSVYEEEECFKPFVGTGITPCDLDNMYTTYLEEENLRLKKEHKTVLLFKSYFEAILNSMMDD
jgi:hypothetical protein